MSFHANPISGEWWTAREGASRVESFYTIRRNGRQIRILRYAPYEYRVYMNRTDGSDGDVLSPDSFELWDDPVEGAASAADDWQVQEAEMKFWPETGMVEITVASFKPSADWTVSTRISRSEYDVDQS